MKVIKKKVAKSNPRNKLLIAVKKAGKKRRKKIIQKSQMRKRLNMYRKLQRKLSL